jgi:hypothetical protein
MPSKKDFKTELNKLISKFNDSVLALHIKKCLDDYEHAEQKIQAQENIPKPTPVQHQGPIPANIGNKVTTGWSNPFGGTSWGV